MLESFLEYPRVLKSVPFEGWVFRGSRRKYIEKKTDLDALLLGRPTNGFFYWKEGCKARELSTSLGLALYFSISLKGIEEFSISGRISLAEFLEERPEFMPVLVLGKAQGERPEPLSRYEVSHFQGKTLSLPYDKVERMESPLLVKKTDLYRIPEQIFCHAEKMLAAYTNETFPGAKKRFFRKYSAALETSGADRSKEDFAWDNRVGMICLEAGKLIRQDISKILENPA